MRNLPWLMARIDTSAGSDGCWPWLRGSNGRGYGLAHVVVDGKKSTRAAHRLVYEAVNGPVPSGLQLDHLCRNRACCNPAHLEPVTPRENTLRGQGSAAKRAAQTHCHKGHPLSGDNLRMSDGFRRCRTCDRARAIAYRNQRRAAA